MVKRSKSHVYTNKTELPLHFRQHPSLYSASAQRNSQVDWHNRILTDLPTLETPIRGQNHQPITRQLAVAT